MKRVAERKRSRRPPIPSHDAPEEVHGSYLTGEEESDTVCENCQHSADTNEHGPDHESSFGYCAACAECNLVGPTAKEESIVADNRGYDEPEKAIGNIRSRQFTTPPTGGTLAI